MVLDTNCGVFGFDQPSSTAWFRYLLNPILYVQNQMLSVLFDPGSTRDNFDSAWPHTRSPISKSALVEVCTKWLYHRGHWVHSQGQVLRPFSGREWPKTQACRPPPYSDETPEVFWLIIRTHMCQRTLESSCTKPKPL